jgi:hypothetical protein
VRYSQSLLSRRQASTSLRGTPLLSSDGRSGSGPVDAGGRGPPGCRSVVVAQLGPGPCHLSLRPKALPIPGPDGQQRSAASVPAERAMPRANVGRSHATRADAEPLSAQFKCSVSPAKPRPATLGSDWGSRGRRFKSGRPDQKVQVRRGTRFRSGPLFDLREPIGEPLSRSLPCASGTR